MNKDLPGFDKSAPASTPHTRGQNPVSAWDIDLSPFHRLVEQQLSSIQQLTDIFTHKMEEFLNAIREEKRQSDKRLQEMHEKIVQNLKSQAKSNAAISEGISEIAEQIGKLYQLLQDTSDRYSQILENVQNNTYNLLRPIAAQETLLREGFTPTQILQPLEKLVVIEEDTLHHVGGLLNISQEWRSFREFTKGFFEKIDDCEKKIENIESLLIALGSALQKYLPKAVSHGTAEQIPILQEINERIRQSLENYTNFQHNVEKIYQKSQENLERQMQLMEQEKKYRLRESMFFWVFIAIAVVLFVFLFVSGGR